MKRTIAIILAILMIASLAACSSKPAAEPTATPASATPEVKTPSKVTVAISDTVATLDPLGDNSQGRYMVIQSFCEYLCTLDSVGGKMEGLIAKSWNQPDPNTIDVEIYDYVYDCAGNHITAKDVAYSYNKCIELGFQAMALNMIDSVTATGDYTVQFKVNSTEAGCMLNTLTGCPIVAEAAYEADADHMANNPVCTGAYVVTEFTPGSSVKMKKNDEYWQKPELTSWYSQANVDEIEFQIILEPAQLTLALETGTVDIAGYMPQNEADNFAGNSDFKTTIQDNLMSQVLLFNCSPLSPFENKELRQAVLYAIDNQAILNNVFTGKGTVNKCFGNKVYSDYVEKWDSEDYYEYNVETAKAKVEESGFDGSRSIVIMTTTIPTQIRMAELIQAYLSEIGIKAEIASYDSSLSIGYSFDPTKWDIRLDMRGAGDYISNVYKYAFDQDMYGGSTCNFYTDEDLQVLLRAAKDEKTHNDDTVYAFNAALNELALGYGICTDYVNYVSNAKVTTELTFNWFQKVMPGACKYVG